MIIGPSFRDLVLGIEDGTMSLQNLNELLCVATPSLQQTSLAIVMCISTHSPFPWAPVSQRGQFSSAL
jgi:hypothetical protein